MHTTVGVFGASGYAGLEATKLLAAHPRVELAFLTSDRWAGERVSRHAPVRGPAGRLEYVPPREGEALAKGCDAVFLATPAETSLELLPRLLGAKARVVDLSGAYRLRDAALYPRHYGFFHAHPELLGEAVYGLPELNREAIRQARWVANPGCYPTASALALAPLLKAGLLETRGLIVDAKSGVTGAGRRATEDYSFAEVEGDFRAYKVLRHQHAPEIAQTLSDAAKSPVSLTFTPHLLPVKRGILVTAYARLAAGAHPSSIASVLADTYGQEPFVKLAKSPDEVSLKRVVETNDCLVAAACDTDGDPGRIVVTAAIDNLLKGAAGQAVQNLNLMMGWEETEGL
jgi:N-acetyl-gamma-glutamyl-phosphate reductase